MSISSFFLSSSGLESEYLVKALYPTLSSFSSPAQLSYPVLYLSRAAVDSSQQPLFLLDHFTGMVVLLKSNLNSDTQQWQYPPPAQSEIQRLIKRVKSNTPWLTPRVLFCKDGTDLAHLFYSHLLEDTEAGHGGVSYQKFMDDAKEEVAHRINNK